ncbi:GreA/GreB family elongation factor [Polyangium spumosum]
MQLDKQALVKEVCARLSEELGTMARIAQDAAAAATHEENKPENDKDMRSTEASYIARGQAERARELERSVALLSSITVRSFGAGEGIAATALVTLLHRGSKLVCFVLPAAGGQRVKVGATEVQVVTPTSPLGAALMGLSEGDEAEVPTPQGTKVYEVVEVR